jgi:undecaprenyl-diphosphatase
MSLIAPNIDLVLSRTARRHRPGTIARKLSNLGSPTVVGLEGLALALVLRRNGRPGLPVAMAGPITMASGKALKWLIHRPRPGLKRLTRKGRQAFPSTHMACSVALLTSLWHTAPRTRGGWAMLGLGAALVLAVGSERVRVGAHWPSDILAGGLMGGLIGAALGQLGSGPKGEPK